MKNTQAPDSESLTLAPVVINLVTAQSHIKALAAAVVAAPAYWKARLKITCARMMIGLEIQEAEARLKLAETEYGPEAMPPESLPGFREQTADTVQEVRIRKRLGKIAVRVVAAAVKLGEATEALSKISAKIDEDIKAAAAVRGSVEDLQAPSNESDILEMEELKKEQHLAGKASMASSQESIDSGGFEKRLRKLAKAGDYKGEPTSTGYFARMNAIDERMRELRDADDGEISLTPETMERLNKATEDLRAIQSRLSQSHAEKAEVEARMHSAAADLEAVLEVSDVEIRGILHCHDLDRKTRVLTAGKAV